MRTMRILRRRRTHPVRDNRLHFAREPLREMVLDLTDADRWTDLKNDRAEQAKDLRIDWDTKADRASDLRMDTGIDIPKPTERAT